VEFDEAHIRASFWGALGRQEFLELIGFGQSQEKIGWRVAEGVSDDQFGGGERMVFGAQPTAKEAPDRAMMKDRQGLQQPLDDEADLDVALIGRLPALAVR
jgi:hypothetical protein